jgi:hypothetical protein
MYQIPKIPAAVRCKTFIFNYQTTVDKDVYNSNMVLLNQPVLTENGEFIYQDNEISLYVTGSYSIKCISEVDGSIIYQNDVFYSDEVNPRVAEVLASIAGIDTFFTNWTNDAP